MPSLPLRATHETNVFKCTYSVTKHLALQTFSDGIPDICMFVCFFFPNIFLETTYLTINLAKKATMVFFFCNKLDLQKFPLKWINAILILEKNVEKNVVWGKWNFLRENAISLFVLSSCDKMFFSTEKCEIILFPPVPFLVYLSTQFDQLC